MNRVAATTSVALSFAALVLLTPATRADDDADDGKVLVFDATPAAWKAEETKGMMAPKLQFAVPAEDANQDPAKVTVHHLGAFAGSVDANIERWCGQFTGPDGNKLDATKIARETIEINGLKATLVELKGRYQPPSFGGPAKAAIPDAVLVAAIVDTPGGPHFVRLLGAEKVVAKNKDAFLKWLKSAKWAVPEKKTDDAKKADDSKKDDKPAEPKKDDAPKADGK